MFFKKKSFKVTVTMVACFDEDTLYYSFEMQARSAQQLFRKFKRQKWIKYTIRTKFKDSVTENHAYIQVKNVADIYITEVVE